MAISTLSQTQFQTILNDWKIEEARLYESQNNPNKEAYITHQENIQSVVNKLSFFLESPFISYLSLTESVSSLPKVFDKDPFTQITALSLSGTKISTPPDLSHLNLSSLDLSDTLLTETLPQLKHMSNLTRLNLPQQFSENLLSYMDFLPEHLISVCKKLQELTDESTFCSETLNDRIHQINALPIVCDENTKAFLRIQKIASTVMPCHSLEILAPLNAWKLHELALSPGNIRYQQMIQKASTTFLAFMQTPFSSILALATPIRTLPEIFDDPAFARLETLFLSKTNLEIFPYLPSLTNLQVLNLSETPLKKFPQITHMCNLKTLQLPSQFSSNLSLYQEHLPKHLLSALKRLREITAQATDICIELPTSAQGPKDLSLLLTLHNKLKDLLIEIMLLPEICEENSKVIAHINSVASIIADQLAVQLAFTQIFTHSA